MAERTDPAVLREQLRELERQVIALRRQLTSATESLPAHPFAAVHVRIGDGRFLLPIEHLVEVVAVPWCEPIAEAPPWVRGSFLNGTTEVPIVDLAHRLFGTPSPMCIDDQVLISKNGRSTGFLVQEVGDLESIAPELVTPPSSAFASAPFLLGSVQTERSELVHLLSSERLSHELLLDS